jgi:hypothetical protein
MVGYLLFALVVVFVIFAVGFVTFVGRKLSRAYKGKGFFWF